MDQDTEKLRQSLLKDHKLKEKDCEAIVSDLHLDKISQTCCTAGRWKTLATHLDILRSVVEDINKKESDDEEKRNSFFYKWKQMKGSEATYKRLVTALLKIDHRLDAESVLTMLKESITGSSAGMTSH